MSKKYLVFFTLCAVILAAVPAAAQLDPAQPDTITVVGIGRQSGAPDMANLEMGVEAIDPDLATAYNQVNGQIDTVINALTTSGVAREDIRTVGLNVWLDRYGGGPAPDGSTNPPVYVVSNNIRVTIRSTDSVPDVLNAGIDAGATHVYGLNFDINDRTALASDARSAALDDARAKAEELAALAGVGLGEIVAITEVEPGFDAFPLALEGRGGGGGGAPIEPGQLSVNVQLRVTFRITR